MEKETDLRRAQLIMLEILKHFDKFCKENSIEYWLDAGTLLGAKRHKGFIPWDDDIDVAMDEKNYKKFVKLYKEEKYFLLKPYSDKNYNIEILKLKDRENFLYEFANQTYHPGIFIDIFCFKEYKNDTNKLDRILPKLYMIKTFKLNTISKSNSLKINLKRFIRYCILLLIPTKLLISIFEKIEISNYEKDNKYIGYSFKSGFFQRVKKRNLFPLKEIDFEGFKFLAPNNIEDYLEVFYGKTYMELPPIDERQSHALKIVLKDKKLKVR